MMEKKEEQSTAAPAKVVAGLKAADPAMWHRIIMCVLIGFAGLAVIGGVVVDFVLDRQVQQFRSTPIVGMSENAILPTGHYYIYQVSSASGGVVVSVVPPAGTTEPADVMEMVHYDPAAYMLDVGQNGGWAIRPTSVYDDLRKKMQGTPEP